MKLAIGADHAGFDYKEQIKKYLLENKFEIIDKGTYSTDSVDYPDFAHPVSNAVTDKEADAGILICGSANGVAIAANKHHGIRAAICWTEEVAQLARKHNDANIICIPARFVSIELAKSMTNVFMKTEFEKGRHERRVEKIDF
ncbi:MAG: ribose 5-phosphate isomerase B [Bacteroidota bacterium]